MSNIIYEKNGVQVMETTRDHLSALWDLLQEHDNPGNFFADGADIVNLADFIPWFETEAIDPLTGLDNGQVVGAAWLDLLYHGHSASINILKKRGYLKPALVAGIMRSGLPYYFEKYDLEKINGYPRADNQACINMLTLIGLKIDGTLRHHRKVKGVWTDYLITSILKEELSKCESTTA